MPPKMLKRPAALSNDAPASKHTRVSEETVKLDAVSEALKAHKELPAHVADMLCSGLDATLLITKEERHQMQHEFLEMVAEAMEDVETQLKQPVESYQEQIAGAGPKKAAFAQAEKEAGEELDKLKPATVAAKAVAASDAQLMQKAGVAYSQSKQHLAKVIAEIKKIEAQKARVESALNDAIVPAKEAALVGNRGKKPLKMLEKVGAELSLDRVMLEAASPILAKQPAARGEFDKLVLKELEDALLAQSSKLAAERETHLPGKLEHEGIVADKEREYNEAAEKAASSKAAFECARDAEALCEKSLAENIQAAQNLIAELPKINRDLEAAKLRLESFKTGALKSFLDMKEMAPPLVKPTLVQVEELVGKQEPSGAEEPPAVEMKELAPPSVEPARVQVEQPSGVEEPTAI